MSALYAAVLEINEDGIEVRAYERIKTDVAYQYNGFSFRVLYSDEEFFQISVYAENIYTTRILSFSLENCGSKAGGKYNVPIMIETDGGFAGVLCTYVFVISRAPIRLEQVYRSMGIDANWRVSPETYNNLKEYFRHLQRTVGFLELMHYIERDSEIHRRTDEMIAHTVVYDEHFRSSRNPDKEGIVKFREDLTLLSAKEAVMRGKHTAILNFANPVEPGGGVLRGAKAQEENICRSGNLYKALISPNADVYYQTNKSILNKNQFNSMFLGSDMVVFSPDVMMLKVDAGYRPGFSYSGTEVYTSQPYSVDVITCAAPFFSGSGYILPNGDLQHILERRIRNILEVAIENQAEVVVLGAFGCGAFHNPPDVAADAFRNVLLESRYRKAFDEIIFAVKRTDVICPNIEAFERDFSLFPNMNFQGNERNHRLSWK